MADTLRVSLAAVLVVVLAVVVLSLITPPTRDVSPSSGLSSASSSTTYLPPTSSSVSVAGSTAADSTGSSSSAAASGGAAQMQVTSIKLDNTSVGSELEFVMTFKNTGPGPLYFMATGSFRVSITCAPPPYGETQTVTATAGETSTSTTTTLVNSSSLPPGSGCTSPSPVEYDLHPPGPTDLCFRTQALYDVMPGKTGSVSSDSCYDGYFRITSPGIFQAVATFTWSPDADSNLTVTTTIIADYSAG
jgi:hypothetical protein